MKKDKSIQQSKGDVKVHPQEVRGSITIAGESVQISAGTVPSSKGASPRKVIDILREAVKRDVFPEPVFPASP